MSAFIGTPLLRPRCAGPEGSEGEAPEAAPEAGKLKRNKSNKPAAKGKGAVQCWQAVDSGAAPSLQVNANRQNLHSPDWACCRCLPAAGEPASAKPASKPAIAPPPGLPPPPASPLAASSPAAVSRPTSFKQVAAAGIRPAGGSPKEGQAGGPETPAPGLQASVDSNCPCSSWLSHLLYLG